MASDTMVPQGSNSPIAVIAVTVGAFVIVLVAMMYEPQSLGALQDPAVES
jgi:hypothetical protein